MSSGKLGVLSEGWVVKGWEEKVLASGQLRVRLSRSKDGVVCRGWASVKSTRGGHLLAKIQR